MRTDGLLTLGRWTTDRARVDGARTAIIDRGVRTTYRQLEERSAALADRLVTAGYGRGAVVATLSGNSVDHIVLFVACAKAGLVLAPISWRLTAGEIAEQLDLVDPDLLVAEPAYALSARSALDRLDRRIPSCELGEVGVEAAVPSADRPGSSGGPVRDDDPLLLVLTSGTTGRSKAVVLTHANCHWTNESLGRVLSFSESDVVLAVMPQYHVGGWNVQPLLTLRVGGTLVLERRFEAGRALRLIEEHGVTSMMGVPTNYLLMAQHPEFLHTDLSSLRVAVVGGGPAPVPLLHLWHDRGVPLTQGYGLSEAAPNVTCLPVAEARTHAGSVGFPYPLVEVARLSDAGRVETGPGTGELLVRGPNVMAGYLRDRAATDAAFVDGWLRTGDLAELDSDGRVRIVDRIKDLFISGGEMVAPVEVEAVLLTHPDVSEAVVAGVPDEQWGERAVAWVVLRPGVRLDVADLERHAEDRLARFKVPREIVVLDRIPRSSSDKPLRRELAEAYVTSAAGERR
ncbi:AMP-binding protein [Nostocoides sp. F2B08]|uniref:class I adenylate-forming enzyme family protein n=1 Tax=Nostocoides sp. F2B08 TaxID=2653936 RepID=UPI001262C8F9|nr:AMP-binding protein [Tetrasphaera sp. F2B08]KAB7745323.1 AMP-binding protein [Tetrasphaera sp. F2B08]